MTFLEVGISSITLSDLEYGIAKSARPEQNKIALAKFLAPIDILLFDDLAAQSYGRIRAGLEKNGSPISPLDTFIAAHAHSLGCTLVST